MALKERTLFGTIDKEQQAIRYIKMLDPLKIGMEEPYYVCISGGKDSDVLRVLCQLAGVRHELVHNHTTADAPETVRYVRSLPDVRIDYPEITMWDLIPKKKMPPTHRVRYCCEVLKERGGKGSFVMTGVRRSESAKRNQTRSEVEIQGRGKAKYLLRPDDDETRRLIEDCHITGKRVLNPIVDWTEDDCWEFLKHYGVEGNPLYQEGRKRVGCVGCVKCGDKRAEEFLRWPAYKEMYIRAFDRMLVARAEAGLATEWQCGEEVFFWWMSSKRPIKQIENQITMAEIARAVRLGQTTNPGEKAAGGLFDISPIDAESVMVADLDDYLFDANEYEDEWSLTY